MRPRIGRMVVLIRVPVALRVRRGELACLPDRPVRAVERIGKDHVGTVGLEQRLALGTRVRGHAHRDADPRRGPEHRVRDGRVAAGRVQQALGRQLATRDAVAQDEQRGAVFHRAARVEPLGLEKDGRQRAAKSGRGRQRDERRIADQPPQRRLGSVALCRPLPPSAALYRRFHSAPFAIGAPTRFPHSVQEPS